MDVTYRNADKKDIEAIRNIYNYYVANTTASFHQHELDQTEMEGIIFRGRERFESFVILDDKSTVIGYVMLTPHSPRESYDITCDITIYIAHEYTAKGIGRKALIFIEDIAKKNGFHNLLSVICGENRSSIWLFSSSGYQLCGTLKEAGYKFGRYLDIVIYQKLL